MTKVWVARTKSGLHTPEYLAGGYAGVGWVGWEEGAKSFTWEELKQKHSEREPEDTPRAGIGEDSAAMGILARCTDQGTTSSARPPISMNFILDLVEGDLCYDDEDSYADGCIWPHRWGVTWCEKTIAREPLPERLRRTLDKTAKTFFRVSAVHEFLVAIGKEQETPPPDPLKVVLDQVLKLSSTEFEDLIYRPTVSHRP